ncbi:hypothetical protein CASbig_63 [Mycobacterium phage CASbig]|uniref:hypothetical protein n=1 Tax=Mycobacterium phage CASbig TaxID=1327035 RepID=UPI00032B3A2A|nr:hypothetical protein JMN56_gp63 [Mycobacterium phage CASbig]AGK88107.1 hypothetical protein CASbig_63 [Mycobacterium phage CASbig]
MWRALFVTYQARLLQNAELSEVGIDVLDQFERLEDRVLRLFVTDRDGPALRAVGRPLVGELGDPLHENRVRIGVAEDRGTDPVTEPEMPVTTLTDDVRGRVGHLDLVRVLRPGSPLLSAGRHDRGDRERFVSAVDPALVVVEVPEAGDDVLQASDRQAQACCAERGNLHEREDHVLVQRTGDRVHDAAERR